LFKNLLTGTSYSVIGSTGVENILSLIGSLSPSIVITDIEMPGLSGRELAKRIRQIEPHVPIVYMSSPEHKNDFIEDKDKYQIYDFLSKPFNRDGIVEMLKRVIKD
jgi:DNA-binding NtrC family response regulator